MDFLNPQKADHTFDRGETVEYHGMPAVVVGKSSKMRTMCEVFGPAHDTGDVYTAELNPITKTEFEAACEQAGHDPAESLRDDKARKVLEYV